MKFDSRIKTTSKNIWEFVIMWTILRESSSSINIRQKEQLKGENLKTESFDIYLHG